MSHVRRAHPPPKNFLNHSRRSPPPPKNFLNHPRRSPPPSKNFLNHPRRCALAPPSNNPPKGIMIFCDEPSAPIGVSFFSCPVARRSLARLRRQLAGLRFQVERLLTPTAKERRREPRVWSKDRRFAQSHDQSSSPDTGDDTRGAQNGRDLRAR
jgi:hypothetical protein